MNELDSAAQRALETLRVDVPTPADQLRIAAKLELRLGDAAFAGASLAPMAKVVLVTLSAVVAVSAAVWGGSRPSSRPPALQIMHDVQQETPARPPEPPLPPLALRLPQPVAKIKRVASPPPGLSATSEPEGVQLPRTASPPLSPAPADEELKVLLEARRALTAHQPARALSLLETFISAAATSLEPERTATRLLALCALGRFDEAERGLVALAPAYSPVVRQRCDAAKQANR